MPPFSLCDCHARPRRQRHQVVTARHRVHEMAREVLARRGKTKTVVVDAQIGYFGTPLSRNSLVTA
jgi:hypothetical protein